MSKEMTPKDALEGIIWRLTSYEDDLELRETDKKEIEIINQALDRLEQLEIADRNNQNLVKTNVDLVNKNLELQKENQELKQKISKFEKPILYMCLNRRSRELERLRLLEVANIYNVPILLDDFETVKENKKLKKIIEILKDKANIRLHILTNTDGSKIYEIEFILGNYSTIYDITQQEYDLLKEFLENV